MALHGSQLEQTAELICHCPRVCKKRGFLIKTAHGGDSGRRFGKGRAGVHQRLFRESGSLL